MDGPGARSGPRAATLLLVALAGAWLLFHALFRHPIGDYGTESDFYGGYAAGARALQAGHVDVARWVVIGPVYEAALALLGFAVRDLFLAAKLLSLLGALVTLGAWAAIGRARLGPWAGVVLAAFVPVLSLLTIRRSYRREWSRHARLARVTLPIWLYVSVTGVIIYVMLYHGQFGAAP